MTDRKLYDQVSVKVSSASCTSCSLRFIKQERTSILRKTWRTIGKKKKTTRSGALVKSCFKTQLNVRSTEEEAETMTKKARRRYKLEKVERRA